MSIKAVSRDILATEMQQDIARYILANGLNSSAESHVAWFHHMQETQPIRYRPAYNLWEVFRYKDVQQILLDSATYGLDKCLPAGFPGALGKSDSSEHRRLRSLVSKAFTPRRLEELTPRLVKIVDELLEQANAGEKMNLETSLAHRLPARVTAEVLGLPLSDQERFQQWSSQLGGQMMGIENPDTTEIIHYFLDLLDKRKCDPRDDLISALLAAEENGTHLTRKVILSLCVALMTASHLSTSNLLSRIFRHFYQHPQTYQTLRDDPLLIPGAIEEMLRYDFSSLDLWRTARHDTVLGGQEIKAGQYVVACIMAANFDETYFPHSSQFDIRRSPNPHLAFGYGTHICLGYPLARLQVRIALERIIARFSEIRLDFATPLNHRLRRNSTFEQFLDL